MNDPRNPFLPDTDRHELWDLLVKRDIDAFLEQDWERARDDFEADCFVTIDAAGTFEPDRWTLGFDSLADYGARWLEGSHKMIAEATDDLEEALYRATDLTNIEIVEDRALAHKKFDGVVPLRDGSQTELTWQSMYLCRKRNERWYISGFVGFLPIAPTAVAPTAAGVPAKRTVPQAAQHVTAGPYSPVLEVAAHNLVVISGQCAIDVDGATVGSTIEEQTAFTMANCRDQLATAGVTFTDVFKVNVYLRDLADWAAFNDVYRSVMPEPLPVRTAVGVELLAGLLVEVEMWAVKAQGCADQHAIPGVIGC